MTDQKKTDPKPPKSAKAEPDIDLVPMRKGGEEIDVHPSCVGAHKAAGWVEG